MKHENCKIGEKIFKIRILDFEIQCTNFLQFNRNDFWIFFVGILVALFLLYLYLLIPLVLISLHYFPKLGYVYILYCIWIVLDRKTASTCGRRCRHKWFRKNPLLIGLKYYFSTTLIKTSELPAGQNYLLAAYPHCVTPLNVAINFLSDANNVAEVFPNIDFCGVSHDIIFFIPLLRDFMLAFVNPQLAVNYVLYNWAQGFLILVVLYTRTYLISNPSTGTFACSKISMKRLLTSAPSKGVIIYPGGASEMCHAVPGSIYRILKSNRKGFIRVALTTGASLVPVFNFGEINILESWMIPNPIKLVSKRLTSQISMSDLVFPKGRGIFQTHFGCIPNQHPVTCVVGQPIPVPKIENPSSEIIDEYHKKYFDALLELFEKYKHTCDVAGADAKLIML